MDAISTLKTSSLFRGWSEADIARISAQSSSKELTPGETLFDQGDTSTAFFVIQRGSIAIKKRGATDTNLVTLGTNDHVGEMAMLTKDGLPEKRSAGAEAIESATVLEIPFAALSKVISDSPSAGLAFYRNLSLTLSNRIHRVSDDFTELKNLRLRHT